MIIKVGDNVSVNVRKILPREGKITGIQISSTGEFGLNEYQVGEYNTDCNYQKKILLQVLYNKQSRMLLMMVQVRKN